MEAAAVATSEIGLAVMATTIAIVAIFLPVAFMKGIIGRFFMQFSLTVVFAVLVSLFVSFTLTPMLSSRYLKSHRSPVTTHQSGRWYKAIEESYRWLLQIALNHRAIVVILATGIFIFSLYMTKFIGKEFVPPEDQGRFIVRLQSPTKPPLVLRRDKLLPNKFCNV